MKLAWITSAVTAILFCIATQASAQVPTVVEIGQTIQQAAGSTSDLYRFSGFTGTTVTATVTTDGEAGLVIYTPDGEEILAVTGEGTIKLDVILPLPDVYFVGVLRAKTTQPYKLELTGVDADRHLSEFAAGVGFDQIWTTLDDPTIRTAFCWIEPGYKKRIQNIRMVEEVTLGRGGRETTSTNLFGVGSVTVEKVKTFDGDKVTVSHPDGSLNPYTISTPIMMRADVDTFRSYLCE